jgi:hypothetical protein
MFYSENCGILHPKAIMLHVIPINTWQTGKSCLCARKFSRAWEKDTEPCLGDIKNVMGIL